MKPQALGVGVTYLPELDPILGRRGTLVDVLEVEPQTFWKHVGMASREYEVDPGTLSHLKALRPPKLLHSLSTVGGTCSFDEAQITPLLTMKEELCPPWISAHLSFNKVEGAHGTFRTGFLLPPRQNRDGAMSAASAVRRLSNAVGAPLAFETGVNYLRPRDDEMTDADFVRMVSERAHCGILLDIHNVWANELNGRMPVDEFLDSIPLSKVWELHVAGGYEEDGFWLDAHSGPMPTEIVDILKRLIPRLPNLGAVIFEIYPSFLEREGPEVVQREVKRLRSIWSLQGTDCRLKERRMGANVLRPPFGPTPADWERALGSLVVGVEPATPLAAQLRADPGIALYRKLIESFRASMVASTLRLTTRIILMNLGKDGMVEILRRYWGEKTPELYASDEAVGFGGYLAGLDLGLPYLAEVLRFELAALRSNVYGETTSVKFPYNPFPVLRRLSMRLPPEQPPPGDFEIEITPDSAEPAGGSASSEREAGGRFHEIVWHH